MPVAALVANTAEAAVGSGAPTVPDPGSSRRRRSTRERLVDRYARVRMRISQPRVARHRWFARWLLVHMGSERRLLRWPLAAHSSEDRIANPRRRRRHHPADSWRAPGPPNACQKEADRRTATAPVRESEERIRVALPTSSALFDGGRDRRCGCCGCGASRARFRPSVVRQAAGSVLLRRRGLPEWSVSD